MSELDRSSVWKNASWRTKAKDTAMYAALELFLLVVGLFIMVPMVSMGMGENAILWIAPLFLAGFLFRTFATSDGLYASCREIWSGECRDPEILLMRTLVDQEEKRA